jgi:HK97 family phage portal protein
MNPLRRVQFAVSNLASAVARVFKAPAGLASPASGGRWWPVVSEWRPGAWQSNVTIDRDSVMAQTTVFACITLIAADIGKMRLKLVKQTKGIWEETESAAFSPVLHRPNRYQTRQKFIEQWITSKLSHGNAYILKERDQRNVVVRMYVLDPNLVEPLVAPDGSVYYQLQEDAISGVTSALPAVPASEIMHDRMVCLFHPLVGVSPIYACGLAATQALKIQQNSAKFFTNMSRASGILTAPAQIGEETAKRLKEDWERNYTGDNVGKVAVLGDGLTYEAMSVTPEDAQLVEQLKLSAEQVASVFHVPAYMVGAASVPPNNNVEALQLQYYSQCLQSLIESLEATLDDGLGLCVGANKFVGTEMHLDDLLRMDTMTLTSALKEQVGAGIATPNEARRRLNLSPVAGGDTPYLQQQNYSLSALDKRDTGEDPFGKKPAPTPAAPPVPPVPPEPSKAAHDATVVKLIEGISQQSDSFSKLIERMNDNAVADHEKEVRDAELREFALALVTRFDEEPLCV